MTPGSEIFALGALLLAAAFGVAAYGFRMLNASGALVASLFGLTILLVGGPVWAVPPLAFFVPATILSRIAGRFRSKNVVGQTRGSRRDAVQVLANGGIGWVLLLVYAVIPSETIFWMYTASFAAAASDTWATEIGTAVAGRTVSITRLTDVPPGTSGGVSMAGWAASVGGGLAVYLCTVAVRPFAAFDQFELVALGVLGGGVVGSAVDSVLGATIQDTVKWLNNDTVNVACTATGAILALAVVSAL